MNVTENAAQALRNVLLQKLIKAGLGFRVEVCTDPHGKTAFDLKVDNQHPGDQIVHSHGITLFLDPHVLQRVDDLELDYNSGSSGHFIMKPLNVAYPQN